jgi:two-component system, chemotaxis family, protein-glutamate methylesterase/glutaminase
LTSIQAVVIGASLGGLTACQKLLSILRVPAVAHFALAQHRHFRSGDLLCPLLQAHTALRVVEAEDKLPARPGYLYVAPTDYHLLLDKGSMALSKDPPVSFARPSIDVLFESAADAYGQAVLAVALTGSNHDGGAGAAYVKRAGGVVFVQDPKTAERDEAPKAVLDAVTPDAVLSLEKLGEAINALIG